MHKSIFLTILCLGVFFTNAQDDLLDLLGDEPQTSTVDATFKGTRLMNMQTNEIAAPGVLQFVFQHRFGPTSDDFLYNFFGLDQAIVRLGWDYSVNRWLNLGIGRSSNNKTWDGSVKMQLLRQKTGKNAFPFSMGWYSTANLNMTRRSFDPELSDRLSYSHQMIFARKFNSRLSLLVSPSMVHFNLTQEANQPSDIFILPLGGRFKITKRVAITAEYAPQLNRNFYTQNGERTNYNNTFSVGVDIETGGHIFQLHVTNTRSMIDPEWMAQNPYSWSNGDIFFGFNISRVFTIVEPKRPE